MKVLTMRSSSEWKLMHDQASAWCQQGQRGLQPLFKRLKLGVDVKSEEPEMCALQGPVPGSRVLTARATIRGKLAGARERTAAFVGERQAPLQSEKQTVLRHSHESPPSDLRTSGACQEVGRTFRRAWCPCACPSAGIEAEAEAPLGVVDLRRADAQVQQHAVHLAARPAPPDPDAMSPKLRCGRW